MRRPLAFLAAALLAGAASAPASAADGDFTLRDPRITESSGLAASRLHPGVYWTHNDSDDGPYLYAVDGRSGETLARVTLSGIGTPRDVEAISVGPGDRLWVGDIGDNFGGRWPHVWIYELPEPTELRDMTVPATQYVVTYEDGPRDAESLVVDPENGRVHIIDKREDGGHLYEGPAELSATGENVFRRTEAVDLWATDAALSPDGERLAVRGYFGGIWYEWNGGRIERGGRLEVPLQGQGESVTYSADGAALLFGSEGTGSTVRSLPAPGGEGGAGDGAEGAATDAGGAAKADGGSAGGTDLAVAAAALLVVGAALFGLRRSRRRG
ncbi:WD40 repeat domain-containing protein [Streptomyces sp. ZYX-F-203]